MRGMTPSLPRPNAIANWLLAVASLVFLMVVVGGITRLTESGLSITEWKPITGVIPPLTEADWQEAFRKYQQIPEYQLINQGMSLAQFKFIFFWEWVHRLLGRVIGLAFAVPLLWFAMQRAIPKGYGLRLVALLALGGLQGAIGWWMVASGLVDRTDVSHYRLATHLLTALVILSGLIWTALDLKALAKNATATPARLTRFGAGVALILFIQLLFGAYTAGLNAGLAASDWPLMNGKLLPEPSLSGSAVHVLTNDPFISHFVHRWWAWVAVIALDDPFIIHFVHRWWAWVAVIALVLLARRVKQAGVRPAAIAIHSAFGTQMLLGIATVMTQVNIVLAVLHQAVGALVVAATIWGLHILGGAPKS